MIKNIIFLGLCYFLLIGSVYSQNLSQDFGAVYRNYEQNPHYMMDVKVKHYNTKDSKPTEEGVGKIVKDGISYYSSFEGLKTICTKTHTTVINKNEKWLMFYPNKGYGRTAQNTDQYKQILEQWIQKQATYLGEEKGIKRYQFKVSKEGVKTLEVAIDVNQHFLVQVIYNFDEEYAKEEEVELPHQTVINYTVSSLKKPSSSWFDVSKYIVIKGEKASLTESYKHYELIQEEN